jgi:hypothetical protein
VGLGSRPGRAFERKGSGGHPHCFRLARRCGRAVRTSRSVAPRASASASGERGRQRMVCRAPHRLEVEHEHGRAIERRCRHGIKAETIADRRRLRGTALPFSFKERLTEDRHSPSHASFGSR